MFDTTTEIASRVRVGGTLQEMVLRWPSDDLWIQRAKGRKFLIKRLGRGVSQTTVEAGESDLKLYEAVELNGAPQLTAAEASRVIDTIAMCEVLNVEVNADSAYVTMEVMGGTVGHTLAIPSADQVLAMRRSASRLVDLPYNQQEVRTTIEPAARLWDKCGGQSSDYVNGIVPALHKDVAIRALIDYLDREITQGADEASF